MLYVDGLTGLPGMGGVLTGVLAGVCPGAVGGALAGGCRSVFCGGGTAGIARPGGGGRQHPAAIATQSSSPPHFSSRAIDRTPLK